MGRMVDCVKLGRQAEGLDFAPYPGELGQRIFEQVSKEAWQMWMRHQTMLINEKRLNARDPEARRYLAEQMEAFFFGGEVEQAEGYVPPKGA
ncbi:MAG: oxidative damage protection protein [Chromatiales bacterium]|nr:oxidative damage protection protein [Chromatiales bacterium]